MARRLLHLLHPGMLVLLDRAFDANAFLREVTATGALLLARAKSTRHPAVLGHLPDGSNLSQLGGLQVRIIEASVTVTGADGSRVRDAYRLITTLMDHRRFPAPAVVRLQIDQRWEIESAYFALRHTLLQGHVLRSGDRPGLEQETWALLTLYQLLRMAMVTAVETCPELIRTGDTITAMEAAKDQLTAAKGVCPDGPADLPGAIGRAMLATRCPRAAPGSAPARSNAPPPGTSTWTTAARPTPPPSPQSTSPSARRRSTSSPAGPTASGIPRPAPVRPGPLAGRRSPPSSPATPHATGAATNSPSSSASNPATCSPSSANGHAWLLHRHRLRHLQTQHTARRHPLDKPARPLTSRLCIA